MTFTVKTESTSPLDKAEIFFETPVGTESMMGCYSIVMEGNTSHCNNSQQLGSGDWSSTGVYWWNRVELTGSNGLKRIYYADGTYTGPIVNGTHYFVVNTINIQ